MPSQPIASDARALREIHTLAHRGESLRRRADADVQRQTTDALLHNISAADELGTPPDATLLPHQRAGVRWLLAMHALGSGAMLADDMGLGKTVQTMAFMSALAARGSFGTHLIIAPLSTLDNWAKEAARWLPWAHATVYRGNAASRSQLRATLRRRHRKAFAEAPALRALWLRHHPRRPQQHDGINHLTLRTRGSTAAVLEAIGGTLGGLVLASYESVLADRGALARLLPWDLVIVDEAQRLKRAGGKLLAILQRQPVGMRVVLTGTPVQNTAKELWTLMGFVAPESFGATTATVPAALDDGARVAARRARGEKRSRRADLDDNKEAASTEEECEGVRGIESTEATQGCGDSCVPRVLEALRAALGPFLLRRTKADAGLALPPKVEVLVPTPLTPTQHTLYRLAETHGVCMNNRLLHLRRGCLYAGWLAQVLSAEARLDSAESTPWTAFSSKLAALRAMLPELHRRGHRVLLFSQFTSVLDVIHDFVNETMPELTLARFDGATPTEDRAVLTAQFQATPPRPESTRSMDGLTRQSLHFTGNVENGVYTDNDVFATPPPSARQVGKTLRTNPCVSPVKPTEEAPPSRQRKDGAFLCLVSTRAGGAGLNLTAADTVILFDGDFNPHNDRQAMDRCHRIGQRRPVVVYRLVCPGTVEADQLAAASRKLALSSAALGSGAHGEGEGGGSGGGQVFMASVSSHEKRITVRLLPVTDMATAFAGDGKSSGTFEGVPMELMDRSWVLEQSRIDTRTESR